MPNATTPMDPVITRTAKKNGPLPAFPTLTPDGAVWWAAYALAPTAPSGTVQPRHMLAHRAGRQRKLVEPGIVNTTDPRRFTTPMSRAKF